ncbi:nucleolar protein 9-like [Ylistrum balloti]|uniref:nucleolar protein 9-like n=1 Tax=Ylistrum balloti TaxID=509963 RepID=UPI002905F735|nr:nucleolar protein 9-like [Ylistrum balloti]
MSTFKHKKGKDKSQESKKKDRIPDEVINYYKRVSETLDEEFDSSEDKDIFLNNVFGQLKEDGLKVCHLASTSRIFERLIGLSEASHIRTLLQIFKSDWSDMLTDRFASHVLQNTLAQVPRCLKTKLESEDVEETEEDLTLEGLFLNLCCYVKDNLMNSLDVYSSHIVRVILQILAGVAVDEQVIRSRLSRNQRRDNQQNMLPTFDKFEPPDLFRKMLKKMTKEIFRMEDFKDRLCSSTTNPVIQTLLLVHHQKEDENKKYLLKVLNTSDLCSEMENDSSLPAIATDEIGSFLVEQILNLGSEDMYRDIYKKVFKGKLTYYALHPVANFILQKLLSNVKEKELFEEMFEEASVLIEDLLALNHLGVVTRMAETCLRLGCRQEKLVRCIMGAFHCADPVERQTKLSPLLLSLSTYEVYFGIDEDADNADKSVKTEEKEKIVPVLKNINYHGSVLMQNLLRFGNPKIVVSGILDLAPAELRNLVCNPCGSHVVDVFCQSPSMGEKSRDLLFKRMKGTYMDIACDKNGSRTLDNMWKCATLNQKLIVAEELGRNESKLQGDRFGFYVHKNCGIFHYKHRLQEWKEVQGQSQKKRKLFNEILNEGPPGKKAKGKETGWKGTQDHEMEANPLRLDMDDEPTFSGGKKNWQPRSKQGYKGEGKGYHIKDKGMKDLLTQMSNTKEEKTQKYTKKKKSR